MYLSHLEIISEISFKCFIRECVNHSCGWNIIETFPFRVSREQYD